MTGFPPRIYTIKQPTSTQQWNTVNVGRLERLLSGVGGGGLLAAGLARRDWPGIALAVAGGALAYRAVTGHSFVYQLLGRKSTRQDSAERLHEQGIKVERAVTIDRPAADLYRFWRDFENLPRFMDHLASVTVTDATHSHWVAKAPAGKHVEWDAEIFREQENALIAWRSLPGSQITNAGSVHFRPAPGGRGTEVRVVLEYVPPAGPPGVLLARLFGEEPAQQVREDLRHFKELMETGLVLSTAGQPSGRDRK